jgi:dihydroorotate dehydrogenase
MYQLLKSILFLFEPEKVHNFFVAMGEILGNFSITRGLIGLAYKYRGPDISKMVDGIRYRTPILLSAGFDYNAHLFRILPSISLGGEEAGSVTSRPCKGNSGAQSIRLKKSNSILVRKGLKNDGVDAIIDRLKKKKRINDFVIGVNIARTNDPEAASNEEGIKDYVMSLKKISESGVADYCTINISCPNAFGGEAFTTPELLDALLVRLDEITFTKPIYVKMPINLSWDKFHELLEVVTKHRINGVVIGNLNKNYDDLDYRDEAPKEFIGGASGKPCFKLSNQLIQKTKETYGNRLTIIGVGGIFSPEDAMEKFRLGADLVQIITGIIFNGPGLVKGICKAYNNLNG